MAAARDVPSGPFFDTSSLYFPAVVCVFLGISLPFLLSPEALILSLALVALTPRVLQHVVKHFFPSFTFSSLINYHQLKHSASTTPALSPGEGEEEEEEEVTIRVVNCGTANGQCAHLSKKVAEAITAAGGRRRRRRRRRTDGGSGDSSSTLFKGRVLHLGRDTEIEAEEFAQWCKKKSGGGPGSTGRGADAREGKRGEEEEEEEESVDGGCVVFVVPTYQDGAPPPSLSFLLQWLEEAVEDYRVGTDHLSGLRFLVVGAGDMEYGEGRYLNPAKRLAAALKNLNGRVLNGVGEWDDSDTDAEKKFRDWAEEAAAAIVEGGEGEVKDGATSDEYDIVEAEEVESEYSSEEEEEELEEVGDLEDIAGAAPTRKQLREKKEKKMKKFGKQKRGTRGEKEEEEEEEEEEEGKEALREMVTPTVRASLVKQGYKVVGTHSGVKLCRWTKASLRGRGGCYKHSFYGIESHRCMEATPSLACANKCVFCWRHHSNPVGTKWKWKMEEAGFLVQEIINNHKHMIKECKGIPGVLPEKLAEGIDMKHCALSLVGEPIMYPEINKFVEELHSRRISSFLVTNAQFPEAIRNMVPVTQLYVSIDAATKDQLKKIDQPLFTDFWERFKASLSALKDKGQRTVYRLTLVDGWNMEEVEGYADLIGDAMPDLIEIKGVTFCGTSPGYQLRMTNVPYHNAVKEFCEALCSTPGAEGYGLACEHEHSLCVLLARKDKFFKEGRWHTWIDYEKFQDLVMRGDGEFSAEDYMLPTPTWAVYGSEEQGFDPEMTRVRKYKRWKTEGYASHAEYLKANQHTKEGQ